MLKVEEIKKMDSRKICAKLDALKAELFSQKMLLKTSGIEKPHRLKELRKDIARLLTIKKQLGDR